MSGPASIGRRLEPQTVALLAVLASALLFVSMSTSVKWLSQHYPVTMVIWARYFCYALIVGLWRPRRLLELPKARHLGLQLGRSALLLIATAGQFIALGYLQIAEVSAIGFLTPLLVTALSAPLLGERVGGLRWIAVGAGLIGALVVVRPGFGTMHWASLVAVAFTVAYALYQISTRLVRDADPGITLLFGSLVGAVVMSAIVPFAWVTPTLPDLAPMGWVALVATSGHALIILALRHGEASLVAAFSYTQLLWALASGWFVFGTFPDAWTLAGAGIIVASGLLAILSRKVVALTDIWLLVGLFVSALTSATVLPGSLEAVLLGLMVKGLNSYVLWTVATVGNVAGSLTSWWLGRAALHYQDRKWFPVGRAKMEQAQNWFRKYGTPALLLSWLPGVGDAFSVAAGVLRVPLLSFIVLVTIAKGFRYALVIGGADWLGVQAWFA